LLIIQFFDAYILRYWERRFSPSTSVLPRQFHSTGASLLGETKKTNNLHHGVAQ
jgi:hypothetical protein